MLSVEMVPSTAWYSNVRSMVRPNTWDRIKREVAAASHWRCAICGRAGSAHPVECHETWTYDDARGMQTLAELVPLCPDCHMVKHFGLALARGQSKYALQWLAQVNAWSPAEAFAHVQQALLTHKQRSARTWALDLSLLARRYGVRLAADGRET